MALVTKSFSNIITFTRASTGTFFNSAGVLQSAAINAPRFDYNPATLAARGLLIEEQRTNSLLRSEDFATTWFITGTASVSTNVASSPAATTTADKFILGNTITSGNAAVVQTVTKAASATTYTASVFVKAAEFNSLRFLFRDTGVAGNNVEAYFNANTGTIASAATAAGTFTAPSATISNIGSGWYRVTLTGTTSTETSIDVRLLVYQNGTGTATGNGTDGILLWGAQLEAGAFPTSYIPTTTTALTRSADVAAVNTLSPWYNNAAGTVFSEWAILGVRAANNQRVWALSDGTNSQFIAVRIDSAAQIRGDQTGGTTIPTTILAVASANTVYKTGVAFQANDSAICLGGGTVYSNATFAYPAGINKLTLGNLATGSFELSGHLRRITYYPRRLSNAELVSITT